MNKIILRFDLDELDEEGMKRFLELIERMNVKANVFALEYQVRDKKISTILHQLESTGCKIGLHSEPFFPKTRIWKTPVGFISCGLYFFWFNIFKTFKMKKAMVGLMAEGLREQVATFKEHGFVIDSHTFHAKNNSPGFSVEENWKLLKRATKEAGCFKSFFSHERIMKIPKGLSVKQTFEPPLFNPVFDEDGLIVYDTCFDDIFFYTMKGDMNDFKENVINILDYSEDNDIDTFIINFHPYHTYNYKMYDLEEALSFLNNQSGWRVVLE